jgi:hypothetical protein
MCERSRGFSIIVEEARKHADRMFSARIAAARRGEDCEDCTVRAIEIERGLEIARNYAFTGKPGGVPNRLEDFIDKAIDAIEYKETHEKAQVGSDELERLRQENKTLRLRVNALESRYGGQF